MKKISTSYIRIAIAALLLVLFAISLKAQNATTIKPTELSTQQMEQLNAASLQRLHNPQACMELKQMKVNLVLWDCGVEDNDTVSINLNGQWILHNFRLTNAKQEIEVTLNPGENQLTLLANNLGDIPDNTAAIAIKENGVEQKATLSSSLQKSGTMRLLVKGGAGFQTVLTGCPEKPVFMDDENKQVRANPDLANPNFRFLYNGVSRNSFEPNRKLEMQGCTNIADSIVTLYFWDSGVEDNDTISINLNGVWVVNNLRLSKAKQSVQVKLQPGSNYIIMYANNLGDIPNNTSGIGVKYKYGERDLGTLYSDKHTSGTFRFNSTVGDGAAAFAAQPCIPTTQTVNNRKKNDPEMQYLLGKRNVPTNQPTKYNPRNQPNYAPAAAGAIGVGVGVITTFPRNGGGNTGGGNTGTKPRKPRQPSGNTPAPTRDDKPKNY
jgi:hypothetical protein